MALTIQFNCCYFCKRIAFHYSTMTHKIFTSTIAALSTASGHGAIAIIRMSGPRCIDAANTLFVPANKSLTCNTMISHQATFGQISHPTIGLLDEVVVTLFRAPRSYTGEDMVEISCHGSTYIVSRLLELLYNLGIEPAKPGEFTLRAFLNHKLDLSQAEAVADLIASESEASHKLAINQLRGGISNKIVSMREQLVQFASLLELELDFSEEDVEFADRQGFNNLLRSIDIEIETLVQSFQLGNAVKRGIPVAIAGKPNVGKSTLLNALLNDERSIVSEIPGTTRDTIEDTLVIRGYNFRFVDTAGIRHTNDTIEAIGIERAMKAVEQSMVVIYLFDLTTTTAEELEAEMDVLKTIPGHEKRTYLFVANKADMLTEAPPHLRSWLERDIVFISAKRHENLNLITDKLIEVIDQLNLSDNATLSSVRHLEALNKTRSAIKSMEDGFRDNLTADLIAVDVRQALHYLGEITGTITTDELLGNIFSKFCIGK